MQLIINNKFLHDPTRIVNIVHSLSLTFLRVHVSLAPPVALTGRRRALSEGEKMPFDFQLFARMPDLRTLPAAHARISMATRVAVVFSKMSRDPRPELEQRLGSNEAAVRFLDLVEEIGSAWPEPVYVNAPCCPRLSYDEMMILDLLTAVGRGQRDIFDQLLSDMIPAQARNRIYAASKRFAEVYRQRQIMSEPTRQT